MLKAIKIIALGALFVTAPAQADHPTGPVELKVLSLRDASGQLIRKAREGEKTLLQLKVISNVSGQMNGKVLAAEDLVIRHEKLFHFFGFDQGLTGFIHEHPEYNGDGTWTVPVVFRRAGRYMLWADVAINMEPPVDSAGSMMETLPGYECTGSAMVEVEGAAPRSIAPARLDTVASATDGDSRLTLEVPTLVADEMAMLPISFSSLSGKKTKITPYLGAIAHFVITNLKGDRIYHVHPMKMSGQWMIHTTLPAGDFRVFAQFIDRKELRTVELSLRVKGQGGQ